jgi:HSP20 family protein
MALIRWEPAAELNSIQSEMNRLFTSLFDSPTRPSSGETTRRWIPAIDLVEDGDRYVLHADLPGVAEQDVSVEVDAGVLKISGERRSARTEQQGGYRRIERSFGSFSRSLTLPDGIDPDAVEASFDKGVLEVRIPKPERIKPRKVTISVAAGSHEQLAANGESVSSQDTPTDAA